MSTDTDRIVNFCPSFHQFWSLPFQVAVSLYLLHRQVCMSTTQIQSFYIVLTLQKTMENALSRITNCLRQTSQANIRSGCLHGLLTTRLLQVVNRLVVSCIMIKAFYPQAFCELFQQVVASLQMTSCKMSDFNRLVANL